MAVVQATTSIVIQNKGQEYVVRGGDLYDTKHPLVKDHPGLFRELVADVGAPVEQATAAPGQKRNR